jgi:hypothetical protein
VAIEYAGETYLPEEGIYYWFPPLSLSSKEPKRPKKLVDGSLQIELQNTTEIKSIYASPLNYLQFMDLTGAFRYKYIAIAYLHNSGTNTFDCHSLQMPITLIEINYRFTTMIDNATGIGYSIERTKTFREINTQKII